MFVMKAGGKSTATSCWKDSQFSLQGTRRRLQDRITLNVQDDETFRVHYTALTLGILRGLTYSEWINATFRKFALIPRIISTLAAQV